MLLLISANSCAAQKIIKGEYLQKYPVYGVSGISFAYHFTDSSFTKFTYEHLGIKTIAKGTYKIIGDTLILNYNALKDPAPSYWKFIKKDSLLTLMDEESTWLSQGIKVQFQAVNRKEEPVGGVNLALKDKNDEVIGGFVSDSLGFFSNMFIYGKNYIQKFHFTFIGRKSVIIQADTLRGYKSKVKIVLSNSQTYYSDYNGIEKYLIKDIENEKIVLQNLENNKKIMLIKQDD
ncbi:MAG TPA: hypothetical protein VK106_06165 [Balneolaceae bacterium]|nr:hypothetical protein [Balneolaceae bacterium]